MKVCTATLESLTEYCQSRYHATEKQNKEGAADYEERTWRNKLHSDENGNVCIPPVAFKFAIDGAAKRLRMQIPGKGKSEYGKHLAGGVLVLEGITLNIKKDQEIGRAHV